MPMTYDVNLKIDACIDKLGLQKMGRVQQYIENEVLMGCGTYVPFDLAGLYENPGALQASGHIEGEDVVWSTVYARYLYYHPEFNFQGAPLRGGYWADRFLQNGGLKRIESTIREMVAQ